MFVINDLDSIFKVNPVNFRVKLIKKLVNLKTPSSVQSTNIPNYLLNLFKKNRRQDNILVRSSVTQIQCLIF